MHWYEVPHASHDKYAIHNAERKKKNSKIMFTFGLPRIFVSKKVPHGIRLEKLLQKQGNRLQIVSV